MQCNGEYLDKERMLKCERALEWRGRDLYLYVDGRPAIWNTASHPEIVLRRSRGCRLSDHVWRNAGLCSTRGQSVTVRRREQRLEAFARCCWCWEREDEKGCKNWIGSSVVDSLDWLKSSVMAEFQSRGWPPSKGCKQQKHPTRTKRQTIRT